MSTDIERELRELFHDKAGGAPATTPDVAAGAPQPVLRRARIHQVGTVIGSAVVVLALVVGSFAGMSSLLRDRDEVGAGDYDVFERTATIEAFTVTSPSDWYLVNQWQSAMESPASVIGSTEVCSVDPEGVEVCEDTGDVGSAHGLPILQLSNVDMGIDSVACRDGLPAGAAVLTVALQDGPMPDLPGSSIPPFPPGVGLPPEADGPCGAGRYARFTLNGRLFFAWIGIDDAASPEDRAIAETAYEMMSADDGWEPTSVDGRTPAYVLAGGVTDTGDGWRLDLRPSGTNVEVSLLGTEPGGSAAGFTVPAVPIESCCEYEGGFTAVTFGAVHRDATSVSFRPEDEHADVSGTIVPLPPSLPFDFDLFFIEGTGGYVGEVIPLGVDELPSASPPPVAEPRAETVELSGSFESQRWRVLFTGDFTGPGSPCWEIVVEGPPGHVCPDPVHSTLAGPSPYLVGSHRRELYLLAGSVPPEVTEIRFISDGDAIVPQQFRCAMGPVGWTNPDRKVCAIALPPEGSGTLEFVDASGAVLFEQGIGWGVAEPESDQYPWRNENTFITAAGSSQGAGWKLQVLSYLDGYRFTFDGNVLFEGQLRVGEPQVITLVHDPATEPPDTIVLVLTGTQAEDVAVVHDSGQSWAGRWIPGSTANGQEARVWLIELPGRGSGTVFVDGVVRSEVSWP